MSDTNSYTPRPKPWWDREYQDPQFHDEDEPVGEADRPSVTPPPGKPMRAIRIPPDRRRHEDD